MILFALLFGLAAFALCEYWVRAKFVQQSWDDVALWRLVAYNQPVTRTPNGIVRFRLYGKYAEELVKADVKLNNVGLMSLNDYRLEKPPREFRIVVLGGEQTASSVVDRSWPDFLELELARRAPGQSIRVLNFAWPDAGPEHYIEYWKEAAKYNPDLVIINFVETDYYRTIRGGELTYRGQAVVHGKELSYRIDGAKATHHVSAVKGKEEPLTLRNPMVIASMPYGFLLEEPFFSDPGRVRRLQETLVEQQIDGALTAWPLLLSRYSRSLARGRLPRLAVMRSFDVLNPDPVEKERLAEYGLRTFGWMARNIPNLVLIHNFHYGELKIPFELTDRMVERDKAIVVEDMRRRIPAGVSDAELQSWFLIPHMGEKWSAAGHENYAKLVANYLQAQKKVPGL